MKSPRLGRTMAVVVFGLAVAGCSGAGADVRTITDDQSLTRFDLPNGWHSYELSELSTLDQLPFDVPYQGFSFPAITSHNALSRIVVNSDAPWPMATLIRWATAAPMTPPSANPVESRPNCVASRASTSCAKRTSVAMAIIAVPLRIPRAIAIGRNRG
jgi:hypothetical protein